MNILSKQLLLSLFMLFSFWASAQKYLQLEITNSMETKKYAIGDVIIYKTSEFPKDWQKAKIRGLDYETNLVKFDKKMEFISDITHVKVIKPIPLNLSRMLYTFAGVSALYGGIGDLTRGELQAQTILYPVGSFLLAIFLDKVVTRKVYPLGKRANLRLLDLRM